MGAGALSATGGPRWGLPCSSCRHCCISLSEAGAAAAPAAVMAPKADVPAMATLAPVPCGGCRHAASVGNGGNGCDGKGKGERGGGVGGGASAEGGGRGWSGGGGIGAGGGGAAARSSGCVQPGGVRGCVVDCCEVGCCEGASCSGRGWERGGWGEHWPRAVLVKGESAAAAGVAMDRCGGGGDDDGSSESGGGGGGGGGGSGGGGGDEEAAWEAKGKGSTEGSDTRRVRGALRGAGGVVRAPPPLFMAVVALVSAAASDAAAASAVAAAGRKRGWRAWGGGRLDGVAGGGQPQLLMELWREVEGAEAGEAPGGSVRMAAWAREALAAGEKGTDAMPLLTVPPLQLRRLPLQSPQAVRCGVRRATAVGLAAAA